MSSSLRLRLAAWLLLPLSLFVAVSAWFSWRNAAAMADYVQDHDLLASAKVLSDRLIWDGDAVQASVPPAALALFASPAHDQVFLSVTAADGRPLAGMPGFPLPARRLLQGPDRAQWYDARIEGRPVRAVLTERAMYDVAGAQAITIAVAKTTGSRDQMVRTLWWPTVEYLLAALALALVLTPLALTWELRPVMRLGRQLARRDPLHLDFAVDARSLHSELRPVGETINQFVRELKAHSEAQRRFIADAAHQMKTPLAALRVQAELALRETDPQQLRRVLEQLAVGSGRAAHVISQLLALARMENLRDATALEPLDVAQLARTVASDWFPEAVRRGIDFGFEGDDADARVNAHPILLREMFNNLIDNALRYTPRGGTVTVRLATAPDTVRVEVEDSGPGIPEHERELVFERFHRVLGTQTDGSGLGLAIVREIASQHGASVSIEDSAMPGTTSGVRFVVRFPRADAPPQADPAAPAVFDTTQGES